MTAKNLTIRKSNASSMPRACVETKKGRHYSDLRGKQKTLPNDSWVVNPQKMWWKLHLSQLICPECNQLLHVTETWNRALKRISETIPSNFFPNRKLPSTKQSSLCLHASRDGRLTTSSALSGSKGWVALSSPFRAGPKNDA